MCFVILSRAGAANARIQRPGVWRLPNTHFLLARLATAHWDCASCSSLLCGLAVGRRSRRRWGEAQTLTLPTRACAERAIPLAKKTQHNSLILILEGWEGPHHLEHSCLSVCLSVYLSVCLPVCLSVCRSVCVWRISGYQGGWQMQSRRQRRAPWPKLLWRLPHEPPARLPPWSFCAVLN